MYDGVYVPTCTRFHSRLLCWLYGLDQLGHVTFAKPSGVMHQIRASAGGEIGLEKSCGCQIRVKVS